MSKNEKANLLDSVQNAAADLYGRNARLTYEGQIVAVAADGDTTNITIETEQGGRYTANAEHVELIASA